MQPPAQSVPASIMHLQQRSAKRHGIKGRRAQVVGKIHPGQIGAAEKELLIVVADPLWLRAGSADPKGKRQNNEESRGKTHCSSVTSCLKGNSLATQIQTGRPTMTHRPSCALLVAKAQVNSTP